MAKEENTELALLNNSTANLISAEDITNLDTAKLKEALLKSSYVITSALYGHAGHENDRIEFLRRALNQVERRILDPDEIERYSREEILELYKLLSTNSNKSFDSILKLNSSITASIDTISKIDNEKSLRNSDISFNKNDPEVADLLRKIIKEKEKRNKQKES